MMTLLKTIEKRRSYYNLAGESSISDAQIQEIIELSLKHAPSAFNSQTSRVVLLKGEEHKALWSIAMETLRKIVPEDAFAATESKINSFAAAYGSVLFFEDQEVVRSLQERFPLYQDRFPIWAEQHSGILQFIIWTALEEAGLGANLQHYNPLIDAEVKEKWDIPASWQLIAQMPFGKIESEPDEKQYEPIETRFRVYG